MASRISIVRTVPGGGRRRPKPPKPRGGKFPGAPGTRPPCAPNPGGPPATEGPPGGVGPEPTPTAGGGELPPALAAAVGATDARGALPAAGDELAGAGPAPAGGGLPGGVLPGCV